MSVPVAAGDNLRAILIGLQNSSVQTNNVFYVKVDSLPSLTINQNVRCAMDGLWQQIKTTLLNVTGGNQEYHEVKGETLDADANLVNGESYFIASGDGVGHVSGETLPTADAWTFKLVRPDATKRHGFKRFANIPETLQVNGQPTSGALASLNLLAAALSTPFHFFDLLLGVETDVGGSMHIELVQRVLNGDVVSPAIFYDPSTIVFDKLGHQDTRDIGRGV